MIAKHNYFKFIIATAGIFCFTSSALPKLVQGQYTIQGYVYNDFNHNSLLDSTELGIKGVAVSNGREVVESNGTGYYILPACDACTYFISTPSGYSAPLDVFFQSKSYIHHDSLLSFNEKDTVLQPFLSFDFPLYPINQPDTFQVLILGDPQPEDSVQLAYFDKDVIQDARDKSADFALILGDITYDDTELYPYYKSITSQLHIPFYNVPGNHDLDFSSAENSTSLQSFKAHFGPAYYSFNYSGVHFVVLNDIYWNGDSYKGFLDTTQLIWLKNDLELLADTSLIVLAMHIPIYTINAWTENEKLENSYDLYDILYPYKKLLILAGHMHTLEQYSLDEKHQWIAQEPLNQIICATGCGTWWGGPLDSRGIPDALQTDGTPNGYHIFSFYGNEYINRFFPASLPDDFQMRIEKPLSQIQQTDTAIIVNVFNADPLACIEVRIDSLAAQTLQHTIMPSPYAHAFFAAYSSLFKPWTAALPSLHIWTGAMPSGLQEGEHTLYVEAHFSNGQIYSHTQIFRIE